jgi:hypothetical protein
MKVVVFVGPTLAAEEARLVLDATFLPPAAQGDVYRAATKGPFAIGIVDGYFERVPSVWHKEILWALSQGIHVFGAASIGAPRAAELHPFGMVGVGRVFEAFVSGALEDDDEVAVAHGDESVGYLSASDPMVNIRATLEAAARAGVASAESCGRIVAIAKSLFYPERIYPLILSKALKAGVPQADLEAVRMFARHGSVNQKREDARAMLTGLRAFAEANQPAPPARFCFEQTDAWAQVVATTERAESTTR